MNARKLSEPMQRVLRCVPDAGSGETVTPVEIAGRLDVRNEVANQLLIRALRRGLVVRLRMGCYQLAPKVTP